MQSIAASYYFDAAAIHHIGVSTVRKKYLTGNVVAKNETEMAFLCSLSWLEHGYTASDIWIPKSVIHDSCHDDIDEASAGEVIEIHIAEWWLEANF